MRRATGFTTMGVIAAAIVAVCALSANAFLDLSKWPPGHQKIIFDTDMGSDVDDVGADVLMQKFADIGYCDILAVMLSVPQTGAAAEAGIAKNAAAINVYYGRPDIPIGIVKHDVGNLAGYNLNRSMYDAYVAAHFPNNNLDTSKIPEADSLYMQILAAQPDTSVTVVCTGYPTNMAQMLLLPGGKALARAKIKAYIQMGGINECCCPNGREGNLFVNAPYSKILCDSFPRPLIFSGFYVGAQTNSGAGFQSQPAANPAKYAYSTFNFSRSSWDPCAMLFALVGYGPASQPLFAIGSDSGYNTINPDSTNTYLCNGTAPRGPQAYISMVGNSNSSDPNILHFLDSVYALPPTCPNCASKEQRPLTIVPAANSSVNITVRSDGAVIVSGMSRGTLELFDEIGRMYSKSTVSDGQAATAAFTKQNGRIFFYRLKQEDKAIAFGKIIVR